MAIDRDQDSINGRADVWKKEWIRKSLQSRFQKLSGGIDTGETAPAEEFRHERGDTNCVGQFATAHQIWRIG